MRTSSGNRSWRLRYSLSDSSVSIDIAKRFGATSRGTKFVWPAFEERRQVALGVEFTHEGALAAIGGELRERSRGGRLPDTALAGDDEQAPIKQIGGACIARRLPRNEAVGARLDDQSSWHTLAVRAERSSFFGILLRAEAHPAVGCVPADLDVGDPLRRHADGLALAVGQPKHRRGAGDGGVDRPGERVAIGVVGHLDLELLAV